MADSKEKTAQKPPNPVWRMMGLPNFRMKLPSRNWMIFLTITGSWTAAVMYDRREKKRIQHKWTKLVEHIAQEPLDERQMPRKLTVYLSAPPADGLVSARDHFREYVQPILVAAALDWDAIEGRREGDVRAGLAERIRVLRKKRGEPSAEPLEADALEILEETRLRAGIKEWDGPGGDIVIGRHTWKEYVRGMHEGWLGPLDPPKHSEEPVVPVATMEVTPDAAAPTSTPADEDGGAYPEASKSEEVEKPKEEDNKPKKKKQPPPFNTTADYTDSQISPNCPRALGPSTVVPFPHLLGFWNFPIRMYRFLNRRQLADEIGRQTAAAVLGVYRPYHMPGETAATVGEEDPSEGSQWEQAGLLRPDELEWHKSARERKEDDESERVWLDSMVIDPRIGERMRRFALDADAEERARHVRSDEGQSWFTPLWPKKEQKAAWEGLGDE